MSKGKKVSVQGFAGEQPLTQQPTQIGVNGFDAATIQADSTIDATIEFMNWQEGQDGVKSQKLRGLIKAIASLTKDGHLAYRRKLATIREVAKGLESVDERKEADSTTEGIKASSFAVYMSNFKSLSLAFEAGMAFDETMTWGKATKLAVEYRKMQAVAGTSKAGRKIRVELSGVDKAVALVAQMTEEEYAEFAAKVAAL